MINRTVFRIALVSFLAAAFAGAQDIVTVKSPDGQIEFRLLDGPPPTFDTQLPHLAYQVDYKGKRLIDTSYLGFELYNQVPLGQKLGLVRTYPDAVDETFSIPGAKNNPIRNHFNEIIAEYLQNGSVGRRMNVEVRAFDDGVAFRIVILPSPPMPEARIENEMTEFNFAKDGAAFPLILENFLTGYEDRYTKRPLSSIHESSLVGLPFLVEQPGIGWAAITEADIDDYAGLYLTRTGTTKMKARLAPRPDGSMLSVFTPTPMVTPWRVVLIGDRPEKLVESDIVLSLNRPTQIKDTSWIQPGKAALSSWAGLNTEALMRVIDSAANAKLPYVLVEAGWSAGGSGGAGDLLHAVPQIDLPQVLSHAKQKSVGVWLWAHWRAVESQMDEAFAQFERWGVRGIVIDGMNRDDQEMSVLSRKVASRAAEHHLMIDFHGASKPDGSRRTFPNVLSYEAVLGLEYSKRGMAASPEHDVMLPFTRMLAGSLDYGVGGFNNVRREEFEPRDKNPMVLGTRAHHLALSVVLESPLQRVVDDPAAYRADREFAFLQRVPVSWDQTKVAAADMGEYVAIARRSGHEWFIGAITNWTAREIDVPLSFLGSGAFIAEIYGDAGSDPKRTDVQEQRVTSAQSLHLKLASGGGAAIRLRPAN